MGPCNARRYALHHGVSEGSRCRDRRDLMRPAQDLGFCGVGKHSYKKAIILVSYTRGSNLPCAYSSESAELMFKTALGIGIFRDFSIETSSEEGSFR